MVLVFQAEDGIRYVAVTGVQTCALPISIEVGRGTVADVELAARGVGVLAPRHRDGPADVLLRVELGGDIVPGTAGAVAFGRSEERRVGRGWRCGGWAERVYHRRAVRCGK